MDSLLSRKDSAGLKLRRGKGKREAGVTGSQRPVAGGKWRVTTGGGWRMAGVVWLAAGLSAGVLHGQVGDAGQRARVLEEPFRLKLDEQVPMSKRDVLDWGGWFRSSFWSIDENADRDRDRQEDGYRAFRQQQLRLWGQLSIDQVHQFYGRMKLDQIDWNGGTSFDPDESDWEGANLERGWYAFRLSRAQWAYGEEPGEADVSVRLGRQYVEFGTGLALSVPLDAVMVSGDYGGWELRGLGARSIPSTHNVDRSVPDNSKESRRYWGLELRYKGWVDHEPFVYYYGQEDDDAGSLRVGQTFGYDSRYVGAGSRGRFFHRDLQYSCEGVGEFGKSYAWNFAANEAHRQTVQAWAWDTEVRYVAPDRGHSQVSGEYLLASGDEDRWFSPSNTIGGNRPHSRDRSFVGWGYRNTGLVLAPQMSNLGAVRLGASTFPLNQVRSCKELEVGVDGFVFHKNQQGGAVSDGLSLKTHNYLGSEIDVYADWRIMSDVTWMVRYGVFWPGDAFRSESERQVWFTGVTVNF